MLFETPNTAYPVLFEAVGCVCVSARELLLLKRSASKSYPYTWGIPSGKVQAAETRVRAMVRELYEETQLLVSAENLRTSRSFHIVTTEMSFLYTVYVYELGTRPEVYLKADEHTHFGWFTADQAIALDLVPELAECLRRVVPHLFFYVHQLSLFPHETARDLTLDLLEQNVEGDLPNAFAELMRSREKRYFVSFGPPASGKTAALRAMHLRNPRFVYIADAEALQRASRLNFYLRKLFEEGDHSFFFRFQVEALVWRFRQTLSAPDLSLLDETIFSIYAYSRALHTLGWLAPYEYQSFMRNYIVFRDLLPRPTAVLYFTADLSTLKRRIARRSRKHEAFYSTQYVETLRLSFARVASALRSDYEVIDIDSASATPDEIAEHYGPAD